MEVEWRRLRADELRARAGRDSMAILPLAALEQHGPHLPVEVDCELAEAVARRTAAALAGSTQVVVLPVVWTGISEHHMGFGGTVTLGFPAYAGLVEEICRSIVRAGFGRIALLNGHGGNDTALKLLVEELQPRLAAVLVHTTYWHAAAEAIALLLEAQDRLLHACETETSMMLALRPELVDRARIPTGEHGPATDAERATAGLHRWRTIAARSASGVIGVPSAASAEKGERLLEAIAAALAARLGRADFWQLPTRAADEA